MRNKVLMLFLVGLSASVHAQTSTPPTPDPQRFKQTKDRYVQLIDQRMAALQRAKTCVQNAQDEKALRECRPERGSEKGGRRNEK